MQCSGILFIPSSPFLFFGGCFCPIQPCPHATFLCTALPAPAGYGGNTENLLGLKRKQIDCEFVRGYRWFGTADWSLCWKHYGSGASQGTSPDGALRLRYSDSWAEAHLRANGGEEKVTRPAWLTGKWNLQRQGCFDSLLVHLTLATLVQLSVWAVMRLSAQPVGKYVSI